MNESSHRILTILDSIRAKRRGINIALFASISFGILLAGISLIAVVMKIGGEEGAAAVIAAVLKIFAFGSIVYAATRWILLGVVYAADRRKTALDVEKNITGINNDLIVSLDLINSDNEYRNMYSRELAHAHIEAASERLATRDFSPVFPTKLLKRFVYGSIGAFAALVIVSIVDGASVARAALFLVSPTLTPNSSLARKIESPLLLGDFEVHYEYPSYTGLPPRDVNDSAGAIRAIKGSVVTIKAKSGESLQSAKLTMEKAELPATLITPKTIEAKITLTQNGRYRVTAISKDDETLVENQAHSIEVIPDAFPEIGIISPAEDREVEEAGLLDLEFASKDDFGLKEVSVVYTLNGKEGRVNVVTPDENKLELSGTYTWDLAALNLRPGDEVRYYLEALDNDAVSGPKKGASKTYTLSIFSPRKEHNRLVDLQWELLDKMVATLGNVLVRKPLPPGDPTPEALKPDFAIADGLEDLIKRLDEITTGLKKDRLGDLNTLTLLENMTVELKNLHALRKSRLESKRPNENDLARRQEAEIPELEKDVIALDNELERQKVSEVMRRGDDLLETQRNISDLLKKAQAGDKNAAAALERELAHMQELMMEMMEALSRSKGNLPDDFMNADALKNMPTSQSMSAFDKMQEAIKKGDLAEAARLAQEMQDMLAKMMASMEGGAQSFGQSRSGEAMKRLAQLNQKVNELKERQKKLFEETQNIGVDAQEKLLEKQKSERKEAMDRLKKLMSDLRAAAAETDDTAMNIDIGGANAEPQIVGVHQNIMRTLDYLLVNALVRAEDFFKNEDFYSMLSVMQMILDYGRQLQRDSQALLFGGAKPKSEANAIVSGADKIVKISEEIIKLLEKVTTPPDRQLSEEDKKRLMEMANEEQKLKTESQQLRKAMEEFRKDYSMMSGDHEKKLGEAGDAMDNAGKKLGGTDPNGALSPEALALQKLSEIGDAMNQLQQRMQQGASGMPIPIPMPGGGMSGSNNGNSYQTPGQFQEGEVEIPGREGYKVPEKYREEILRAMQQKSPEAYQRLNRDYYKKLVQ